MKTDRNPVVLQESFQLIFEADGDVDGKPDFSPLNRDFRILSTSSNSSVSITNSGLVRNKQWRLTLLPLRVGELIIPAIAFGKDVSPRSALTVRDTPGDTGAQPQRDVFIEVEVSPYTVFVQAEIIYTVKLYRSVATANESLSGPELGEGEAVIEQLDADRSFETTIGGRRYGVFERRYAIYPQVSGTLVFAPIRYQGQLTDGAFFGFDPFTANGKVIVRQSAPARVQIKPAPTTHQADHWLPASALEITEQWSKDPLSLTSGEPVTRTVTLTAQGLTASQLPALPETLPAGFRQYPDTPALENRHGEAGITGVRQQKYAIIPARSGEYILPEIKLPWWNTQTQTTEYAVLPERKVRARAAAVAPDLLALDTDVPEQPSTDLAGAAADAPVATSNDSSSLWQWLTGALALLWALTLCYALWQRRRPQSGRPARPQAAPRAAAAQRALRRACEVNDPQRAKTALLQWAAAHSGERGCASLGILEERCGEELAVEIRKLSRQLYSGATTPWQGKPLWEAFAREDKSSAADSPAAAGELEPLFRL